VDVRDPVEAVRMRELTGRLVFLGFNSRVAALDRVTGEILWHWKSPRGTSNYVALLLDDDRLIVSVQGFTYCLNPLTGEEVWCNPLDGFGYGIPTLVSVNGSSSPSAAAEEEDAARRRSSSDATTPTNP
jgi:outer membrane protein assembly factor BamB